LAHLRYTLQGDSAPIQSHLQRKNQWNDGGFAKRAEATSEQKLHLIGILVYRMVGRVVAVSVRIRHSAAKKKVKKISKKNCCICFGGEIEEKGREQG
jgi:hypothetical protein